MLIKKRKIGFFIAMPLLLLVLSVTFQASKYTDSFDPEVLSVTHQPTIVSYQTNLTITITFDNDVNVTGIQIQYCQLDPSFTCHFPKIDMVRTGDNIWTGFFIVQEESGIIGYKFYITNQTINIVAPNKADYLGYNNIMEPAAEEFYFSVELGTATNVLPMNLGLHCVALTFGAIVLIRRKLRKIRNV